MPKPKYLPPNMINKYMVDHKDPEARHVIVLESCATFHTTMQELEKDTHQIVLYYEMFVQCPSCRFEGRMGIPSALLMKEPDYEVNCPSCAQPINVRHGQALYYSEHMEGSDDQTRSDN
jgi:hypothetical protein